MLGTMFLCNFGIVPINSNPPLLYNSSEQSQFQPAPANGDAESTAPYIESNSSITNNSDSSTDSLNSSASNPQPPTHNPDDPDNPDPGSDPKDLIDLDPDESLEPAAPPFDFGTDLIISAFNPGYTINGKTDQGEFIELTNTTNSPLELAGYSLQYDFGSNSTSTLFTFPEGSYMTGKHLLLKYSKTDHPDQSDLTYNKSLALSAGPLQLIYDNVVVDHICWREAEYCDDYNTIPKFSSTEKSRRVAQRNFETGEFEQIFYLDYIPEYHAEDSGLYLPPEPDEDEPLEDQKPPQCRELEFSELLTYYDQDKSEQFIEFFNPTSSTINLNGCFINYKNKNYPLSGEVSSGGYYAFYPQNTFVLTKNPKNPLALAIIDADGATVDEIAYPNGQKKSTTYAKVFDDNGSENWQITYAITPSAENVYQRFRSCEEGKIINEATGNCVKVTTIKSASAAAASALKEKTLAPCPAGKYRNPLTGRCKSYETTTSSTLKPCAEGYERNPETNRCRKIKTTNDGADFAVVPTTRSNKTTFIGFGILAVILVAGASYVALQFRHEIARAGRKLRQRVNSVRHDLLSRRISRHRNKKP